jgi:hypothetical protein
VDSVPDPLLLRKSGRAGNRTRTSQTARRQITEHSTVGVVFVSICRARVRCRAVAIVFLAASWQFTWPPRDVRLQQEVCGLETHQH